MNRNRQRWLKIVIWLVVATMVITLLATIAPALT